MARQVLIYVEKCVNRSAPQEYVDKAAKIWDAASPRDQQEVEVLLIDLLKNGPKGDELCQQLGTAVRVTVAWDFALPENFLATRPTSSSADLSAKITRIENAGDHIYPLIVVENRSDAWYSSTRWSAMLDSLTLTMGDRALGRRPTGAPAISHDIGHRAVRWKKPTQGGVRLPTANCFLTRSRSSSI
jgi:hypothetical protein